jgi:putative intracellular protease/amidase
MKGRVLLYTSSASRVPHREGGGHECGTWLSEITHPLEPLARAGYSFDCVTPDGRPCVIDGRSRSRLEWLLLRDRLEAALEFMTTLEAQGFGAPKPVAAVLADEALLDSYDALFVPGGHAPMTDVLHVNWFEGDALNERTGRLLRHFHDAGKPTALICHAPAVLGAAPYVDGKWIYHGYEMTCVSPLEEWLVENLPFIRTGGHKSDYPKDILERHGGIVRNGMLFRSCVVEDRELLTAQDPFSGRELGTRVLAQVDRYVERRGAAMNRSGARQAGAR